MLVASLILAATEASSCSSAEAATGATRSLPDPVAVPAFRAKRQAMLRRSALIIAPVLANGLYASFACAHATLQQVDPLVFSAMQMTLLLPVAAIILRATLRPATSKHVRLGLLGGLPLGVGFVCIALALRSIGIVTTAMLTALDGIVASGIAWLVLRERLSSGTWLAIACAAGGAACLCWMTPSQWQTDLVAIGVGILFTLYAFHVERTAIAAGSLRHHLLPFLGGVFVSLALTALVLALCFGRWNTIQAMTATDWGIVLYCGLGTVLLPLSILTLLLRHVNAITLAFLAALEPLMSLGFAFALGSLSLPLAGWCGVVLILGSILLQTNANAHRQSHQGTQAKTGGPGGSGEEKRSKTPMPLAEQGG